MILAVDLALRTGWAGRWPDGELATGVWDIRAECDTSPGRLRSVMPAIGIRNVIAAMHAEYGVTKLVIENAYARPGASTWIQISMQTAALMWCHDTGRPFSRYRPTEWKKHLLGKGTIKRDEYHALARDRWPELSVQTDDEAAALWLLEMDQCLSRTH